MREKLNYPGLNFGPRPCDDCGAVFPDVVQGLTYYVCQMCENLRAIENDAEEDDDGREAD
jgi:hypothetical protein